MDASSKELSVRVVNDEGERRSMKRPRPTEDDPHADATPVHQAQRVRLQDEEGAHMSGQGTSAQTPTKAHGLYDGPSLLPQLADVAISTATTTPLRSGEPSLAPPPSIGTVERNAGSLLLAASQAARQGRELSPDALAVAEWNKAHVAIVSAATAQAIARREAEHSDDDELCSPDPPPRRPPRESSVADTVEECGVHPSLEGATRASVALTHQIRYLVGTTRMVLPFFSGVVERNVSRQEGMDESLVRYLCHSRFKHLQRRINASNAIAHLASANMASILSSRFKGATSAEQAREKQHATAIGTMLLASSPAQQEIARRLVQASYLDQ
jgi:hypothetical protein